MTAAGRAESAAAVTASQRVMAAGDFDLDGMSEAAT
jgi:hypothetical protein